VEWEKQTQFKANTKPIQSQYKANSNPKQTQFVPAKPLAKPVQTQCSSDTIKPEEIQDYIVHLWSERMFAEKNFDS
jgi:hypothetical protein